MMPLGPVFVDGARACAIISAMESFQVDAASLALPATFAFSQSSLQAFDDCPRRFWLAYVQQLPWPAVEAAPVQEHEELLRLGSAFHRLVERAENGIDTGQLSAGLRPPLSTWFAAYVEHRPSDLPAQFVEIEHVLSIPFLSVRGRYRLAARYDLIAADKDGRVVIVDWKTTQRRTDPAVLRQRLQSAVYPFVLVEASARFPWGPVRPEQVEMLYWFAPAPAQPVVFRYDGAQHAATGRRLLALLDDILSRDGEEAFPLVLDTDVNRKRFCNYCVYRSRCGRGAAAGNLLDLEDLDEIFSVDMESALGFSFTDIPELAF